MRDWRVACGGGFLGVLALAALLAPWLPLRDPAAQPDTGGLRELPPLARPYVVELADGTSRYAHDLRPAGASDGAIELLRASGWQRVAAEQLHGRPHRETYLLGTDAFGRDLLARVIHGARASLAVGLLAALIALAIGTTIGAAAGLAGGLLDVLLMRFVDLALSVPRLFAALLLVTLFEPGLSTTIVVLGATSWMVAARLVRGEFLSLRERDFVHAARATGVSWLRMTLRHVLPSAAGPVLVEAALRVGDTILLEAALSFLGLGVQPPAPSWGNMVADGRGLLESAWWISTLPGLAIGLTVLALNLLADVARERLSARRVSPEDRLVRAPARTYIPPPVRGAAAVHPLSRMGRP